MKKNSGKRSLLALSLVAAAAVFAERTQPSAKHAVQPKTVAASYDNAAHNVTQGPFPSIPLVLELIPLDDGGYPVIIFRDNHDTTIKNVYSNGNLTCKLLEGNRIQAIYRSENLATSKNYNLLEMNTVEGNAQDFSATARFQFSETVLDYKVSMADVSRQDSGSGVLAREAFRYLAICNSLFGLAI